MLFFCSHFHIRFPSINIIILRQQQIKALNLLLGSTSHAFIMTQSDQVNVAFLVTKGTFFDISWRISRQKNDFQTIEISFYMTRNIQ